MVQRLWVSPYGLPRLAAAPIFSFINFIDTFVPFVSVFRGEVVIGRVKGIYFYNKAPGSWSLFYGEFCEFS